jgi:hypothetical protein
MEMLSERAEIMFLAFIVASNLDLLLFDKCMPA